MYRLLLVLAATFLVSPLIGQADIEWGKTIESDKRGYKPIILGQDDKDVFVLRVETPGNGIAFATPKLYFEVYNERMVRTRSLTVDLKSNSRDEEDDDFETSFMAGGQIWLITSQRNRKEDYRNFYAQAISLDGLKQGKKVKFASTGGTGALSRMAGQTFDWAASPDGKKIVLIAIDRAPKEPEKYEFAVLSSDMDILWSRKERLRTIDKEFDHRSIKVDVEGNVYVLARKTKGSGKEKEETLLVLTYTEDDKPDEYVFNTEGFAPTDMTVEVAGPGRLVTAGIYADPKAMKSERSQRIKGFFYREVDVFKGDVISSKEGDFSDEFLTADLKEKAAERKSEKGKTNTRRFDIQHIIRMSDGSMLVLGEQFSSFITSQNIVFDMKDIMVVRLEADGTMRWAERVAKHSSLWASHGGGIVGAVMADKFSPKNVKGMMMSSLDLDNIYSYGFCLSGDKVHLMFNDDPRNLEDPEDRRVLRAGTKKMLMVDVTMDINTGEIEKSMIFNAKEEDRRGRPAMGSSVSNSEFVFFSSLRKEMQMAKVSFD